MKKNSAVGVGKEGLASLAWLDLIEFVGAKPVEEFGPLAAGDFHLGDTWRSEEPRPPAKSPIFGFPVTKIGRHRSPAGILQNGPVLAKNVYDFTCYFHGNAAFRSLQVDKNEYGLIID